MTYAGAISIAHIHFVEESAKVTLSKTFKIDAILINRRSKTFLVDANLRKTFTKLFTVDAILKKTTLKTLTIDSILKATLSKTFKADANLRKTFLKTIIFDAVLKTSKSKTFTIDATLRATQTKLALLDAVLKGTISKSFNLDAILVLPTVETFGTNLLTGRYGKPPFIPAVPKAVPFDRLYPIKLEIEEIWTSRTKVKLTLESEIEFYLKPKFVPGTDFTIKAPIKLDIGELFSFENRLSLSIQRNFLEESLVRIKVNERFNFRYGIILDIEEKQDMKKFILNEEDSLDVPGPNKTLKTTAYRGNEVDNSL